MIMRRSGSGRRSFSSCIPGRKLARLRAVKQESGSTLVEFALVFLLLMTILLGIADFGHALYTYHFVSHMAREATRYAAVRGHNCADAPSSCIAANSASGKAGPTTQSDITDFVQNVPLGIDGSGVKGTITWPVGSDNPSFCSTTATQNAAGCTVQVVVTYTYQPLFPFVSSIPMSSTSRMVIAH